MEEWKEVIGYEKKYIISNHGNVMSLWYENRETTKPLKLGTRKDGYLQVHLYKDGKEKLYLVHRLVAEAFVENPNNFLEVNHKNGIKTDNNAENLEWCTHAENMQHAYTNELHKKYCGEENWNSKSILQYDLNGKYIKTFPSISSVDIQHGKSHISDCCKGKRNSAGGFIWKYGD